MMAEYEKAKASRLEKAREKRRLKQEHTGDTPEAAAERRKAAAAAADYDADTMKKRVGNPGAALGSQRANAPTFRRFGHSLARTGAGVLVRLAPALRNAGARVPLRARSGSPTTARPALEEQWSTAARRMRLVVRRASGSWWAQVDSSSSGEGGGDRRRPAQASQLAVST